MDKSPRDIEIDRILTEAVALRDKAQLDLDTAEFFNKEALRLEAIVDDLNTLPEDKESAMVKMEALTKRILIELREDFDAEKRITDDLNAFIKGLSNE